MSVDAEGACGRIQVPVSTSWVCHCVSSIIFMVFVHHRVQENKLAVAHHPIRGPLSWPELAEVYPSCPLVSLGSQREAEQCLGLAVVGGRRLPLKQRGRTPMTQRTKQGNGLGWYRTRLQICLSRVPTWGMMFDPELGTPLLFHTYSGLSKAC